MVAAMLASKPGCRLAMLSTSDPRETPPSRPFTALAARAEPSARRAGFPRGVCRRVYHFGRGDLAGRPVSFHARRGAGFQQQTRCHDREDAMSVDRKIVDDNTKERQRLKALVERLSDADLARPLDAGWTVAGVFGHLAFW